jgi:ParB family transcriptional regulator, chromosome partitioning protein
MARESRGLGRGLEALLSARPGVRPAVPVAAASGGSIPIADIQAGPSQPRRSIQAQPLEELAASIRANGVIQPIVVRPLTGSAGEGTRYEIVAGERRWQAAKLAGLTEIPVVVRELSDSDAVAVALIENIQREELTPAEEARALQRLIGEFTLTHQQVADAVGRSRAAVTNLIRLLDLPAEVVALIDAKSISMGHARALLGLEDDAERVRLGELVAERGLSVRETENLVRKALQGESTTVRKPPELSAVSEVLRTKSVRVELQQKASGSARIVVDVADSETREAIIEALKAAVNEQGVALIR